MQSQNKIGNLKLGLCCLFHNEPIKFKTYTFSGLQKLSISEQEEKIFNTINHNIKTLQTAIDYCVKHNIPSYRFSSDLFPHFDRIKYMISDSLMEYLFNKLKAVDTKGIKISCHPGQHVNLGSPYDDVVVSSRKDLEYHAVLSNLLDSREINIHLGGIYNDKPSAKERFIKTVQSLSFKNFLTIENDELSYSIEDCLEVANILNIPVTFDLHHHRCYSIGVPPVYTERELFQKCKQTWINAGYNYMRMHISEPKSGYTTASKSRPHSDIISIDSIPEWLIEESYNFEIHLDIEAKHKEIAIFNLMK